MVESLSGMKIYLMRHGHCPSLLEAGLKSDALRPLSERGRKDVRKAGRYLAAKGVRPGLILCSPLLRAQQTAQELAAVLGNSEVRPFEALANIIPGAELARVATTTDWASPEVVLVGHMPQIAEAAAQFLNTPLNFSPAEIAAFEVTGQGKASLLWKAAPEQMPE